jgi:hypothetical protein
MPGRPAGGTGPWKLVTPRTLCGLPQNNSAQQQETGQGLLGLTEENLFGPLAVLPDVGNETSAFATSYNTPDRLGVYRYVNVLAFNGTFNPTTAVHALATADENSDIPGNVFHSVPAGPHGGVMECAPSYTAEECVWATSTTLGDITIDDTSNELTGDHTDTNAIRIRDALEVMG